MGIYIKGMEVPKSCSVCPMLEGDSCSAPGPWAGRVVATAPPGHVPDTEAPAWCPVRKETHDGDSKQV